MPTVGIVVVNYNTYQDTKRCLESLLNLDYPDCLIYCVDNHSTDGSLALLNQDFADRSVVFIKSPENLGFAGGCNVGIKESLSSGASFVWLINSDASVEKNSLKNLVAALDELPRVAAAGSKILFAGTGQGVDRIWSAGGKVDISTREISMEGYDEEDRGQHDKMKVCDYLPGCSLLLRREAIEKVGLLPEKYFMYFEETDWCMRATRDYGPLLYVPQSVVRHHVAKDKTTTPFMVYYYNRNSNFFWLSFSGRLLDKAAVVCAAFKALFRSIRAYNSAPSEDLKKTFRSHMMANYHFLIGSSGRYREL